MAMHKKEEFTQKEHDLANFAKAMAHPARIAILKVLAQRNECVCGEIVDFFPERSHPATPPVNFQAHVSIHSDVCG